MIRHVVVARFRAEVDDEEIDSFIDAMRRVHVQGMRSLTCGRSVALRPGGWDYALVADFDDEEAYRRYDDSPEHRRVREEFAPRLILDAARVQVEVAD